MQNNSPQPGPSGLQKQSRPPTGDSDDSDFDSDEFAPFMFPDGMTVDEREVAVLIETDSQVKILFDLVLMINVNLELCLIWCNYGTIA